MPDTLKYDCPDCGKVAGRAAVNWLHEASHADRLCDDCTPITDEPTNACSECRYEGSDFTVEKGDHDAPNSVWFKCPKCGHGNADF